jgi:Sulfotransferase domain
VNRRPDFFIIGAPRCGTTALYDFLRQHPEVYMPQRKEPVYFGADLTKRRPYLTEQRYLDLFRGAEGKKRVGEATVWYLYSETAPMEIAEFTDDPRLVVMVRNPVDMMHSLHGLLRFTGNEDLSFEDALDAEPDRARGRRLPANTRRPEGLQYRRCARYAEHLDRWISVLGRERIHVIVFDDFRRDALGTYRSLLEFLGVDPSFVPRIGVVNANKAPRSVRLQRMVSTEAFQRALWSLPEGAAHAAWRSIMRLNSRVTERTSIEPALRERLNAEMADSVIDLGTLLHRDLTHWSRA